MKRVWQTQSLRFIIVGLGSNAVLYVLYLLLTSLGMGYKTAMTLLFATGVVQTYFFNQRWTFELSGFRPMAMVRYTLLYGSAYFINLLAFYMFVENLGFPHQVVQAAVIPTLAIYLFVLQKCWVFEIPKPALNENSL